MVDETSKLSSTNMFERQKNKQNTLQNGQSIHKFKERMIAEVNESICLSNNGLIKSPF